VTEPSLQPLAAPAAAGLAAAVAELRPSPYLHVDPDRVYDPLTDRSLLPGDAGEAALRRLLGGGEAAPDELAALRRGGWVVGAGEDLSRRHFLKYVSIEAHTVCNQSCYFCPVAVAPRENYFMPTELYERIVGELAAYRATVEAVFMINYNEPTVDRRFVDQVRAIKAAGLPPAVLTNGTGLTPARIDALVELGGLRFLSINLSTLDAARYVAERGGNRNQLAAVLRHLDHAKHLPLAEQMDIVVLGTGDERHRRDYEEIRARFAGSRFAVKSFAVMDRAGYLQIGLKPTRPAQRLGGCDNFGSRPLQHLHVTPRGQCVLCCEDYDEHYVVGDLTRQTVAAVLAGPEVARLRRWTYGVEDAPADFICRKCVFARTR